jgi:hypothetical protein
MASASSGRGVVRSEKTSCRAVGFSLPVIGRSTGPETVRARDLIAGAGPTRGDQSTGRPRVADDARNPAIKICAHPRLGKIRHHRFPGRQGLWGCRRQHRAHSQATLTASASWPWTPADVVAGKRKAPRGAWRFRVESIVVGDHSPHGRGIALSGFKSSGRLPSSTFGETSTVHVNWSRTGRTGVRRFRPRRPTPASCRR